MARLIDADRALEIVRDQGIAHPNAYHLTNYATLILREAPTVNAVEVVRCRDCKHWDVRPINGRCTLGKCLKLSRVMGDTSFCSYGERKDGGQDG